MKYNPYSTVPKGLLFLNSTVQIILGVLILIVAVLALQKYLKVKSRALLYLTLTIITIAIAYLLSGFGTFTSYLEYSAPINPNPIVFGIPIFFIKDAYWPLFNIAYSFGMLSFIFMMYFSATIFQKPEKLVLYIYTVLGVLWIFYATYNAIFIYGLQDNFDPKLSSVGSFGLVTFLLMGLVVYIPIFIVSYKASGNESELIIRRGLQLIAGSTVCIVIYLALFALNGILGLNLDLIPLFFAFIASVLLYLGYVMPDWFVKRIRGSSSS